ncbi:MAG: HIRAN domain-containing protein [Anaerolineae bacterium]
MRITRRDLCGRLLRGVAVLALGSALPKPEPPRLVVDRFWVAGFRYYEGLALLHALRCGDALTLEPEPTNPYDERAVEVFWRGRKLGYVPRRQNAVISRLLKQGAGLDAHIQSLQPDMAPWEMVEVEVCL